MQHLVRTQLILAPLDKQSCSMSHAASLGPFFQGVLMENLDKEYASFLHALPFNPYSQCCYCASDGNIVWQINALNNEAAEHIEASLKNLEKIDLHAVNKTFSIEKRIVESMDIAKLTNCIQEGDKTKFKVRFFTPTAFKSQGEYVILPSVRLIFQNLLMHYGQIYSGDCEVDEETLDYITQNVRIASYSLRSQYFAHSAKSGSKIPAFLGEINLNIRGPKALCGLTELLLKYGEYSGVGIKTAMGMGAMAVIEEKASAKKDQTQTIQERS